MMGVLVVSLILVVLMGYATARMQQRLELAEDAKAGVYDLARVNAKMSELTYLLATQRITAAGVSIGQNAEGLIREDGQWRSPLSGDELRSDGYVYKASELEFSIQNETGLIPVNTSAQYWLKNWLARHGYGVGMQNRLAATLADYADADTWRRPGGVEASSDSPGNYLLQRCDELWRIEGWAEILERHPNFLEHCSLRRTPALNINAVPEGLWRLLWPDAADKVANARIGDQWVHRDSEVLQYIPGLLSLDPDLYKRRGGQAFIIKVWGETASSSAQVKINPGATSAYTVKIIR